MKSEVMKLMDPFWGKRKNGKLGKGEIIAELWF